MSEHKKIPVILDGDPGHDDAIAWVLARASRDLGILAVTSCCGNQTIEKTTYNALRVCTLIGLHAPVGKGCPHPLLNDVMNAPSVHGESGLDGPALPEPAFEASALSAPELMAKVLRESPEPVTIVATGPQTNVAAGAPGAEMQNRPHFPDGRRHRHRQLDACGGIQHSRRPGGSTDRIHIRRPHHNGRSGRDGKGADHAGGF